MFSNLEFEKEKNNIILVENNIQKIFNSLVHNIYLKDFELEFQVSRNHLFPVLMILKYSSLFLYRILVDLAVMDHPKKYFRFVLFYQLNSDIYPNHCRVITQTDEYVRSITQLFPAATWAEREAWDMFGLFFSYNYDLRRVLTDYGFEDFPLQKTFKLIGTYEIMYNDSLKRIVYQNINETQKFREFTFLNPWGSFQVHENTE